MNAITVNREILLCEDFTEDFAEKLCAFLNSFIDTELEKGNETDFDLVDEYAEAINFIRENGIDILPVISNKTFLKKLGIERKSALPKIAVAAAVIIALLGINSAVSKETKVNIIAKGAEYLKDLLTQQTYTEEQTAETVFANSEQKTTGPDGITGIELVFEDDFRTEYYVGESFDRKGLYIYLVSQNGKTKTDKYEITTDSPFAEKSGEQTVTVSAKGFSKSFTVRIINNEKTPLLNSVYATFPDGFDFTYRSKPDLNGMRVFAVYSNGDEKELSSGEYSLSTETTRVLLKEKTTVTVEYGGCTCSFELQEG